MIADAASIAVTVRWRGQIRVRGMGLSFIGLRTAIPMRKA